MRPHALPYAVGLALALLTATAPAQAQALAGDDLLIDPALLSAAAASLAPAVTGTDAGTALAALPALAAEAAAQAAEPAQAVQAASDAAQTPPADAAAAQAEPVPSDDPRTEAERDFDALYGTGEPQYDPVADSTLPAPATVPVIYDPWERYNRKMHRFNNAVDRGIAKPLARAYVRVVPRPVRLGVSNFFNNLGQPVSAVNALLQGKPKQAAQALGRFALNTTVGIGGIFDPASDAKLPNRSEDFGQTLGVWGWKRSRYLELPLFGPRTVRDAFGAVGDAPLSPLRQVESDRIRIPLQGLQLVDVRAQLMPTDALREGAEDDYTLVRDSWMQRRDYQIFGDRMDAEDQGLPDYLRDDSNPSVPADAMPLMPTDANYQR
ncbi:MlaA family lipoprotein [Lysobacter silvisoli]|uniref:VacJ family lipoprotein n=1 Tax=Lysobacter silvisoli TaxID=2293254 RepID=A0A371JY90_9GAMM|nr:MlaA family lipoprotein [Lysobacter silvisoli]RDZ26626.1 VacJ family lipoprotein [Lysobacter silvisoli]